MLKKLLIAFALTFLSFNCPHAGTTTFKIGTGGVTGVYYPTGIAISKVANARLTQGRWRYEAVSTPGSVHNIDALMRREIDLAIVQSDRQYQAVNGLKDWQGRPQKMLAAIFSLHAEPVTLLAVVDAGIDSVEGLKGKTVNIGNPGSGQRGNSLDILEAAGIDHETMLSADAFMPAYSSGLLQDGDIDAYFYTVGHPNSSVKEATSSSRKVRFVPLGDELINTLLDRFPYYLPTRIPVRFYPRVENSTDVESIGVVATVCVSLEMDEEAVYSLVKTIFENLEQFKGLHPALGELEKGKMLEGISAPIHPGALRYYKEVGLL